MTYLIPDRKAVAQLKYQLRRFEKQCADLPAFTRLRVQQTMQGLRDLLVAVEDEHPPLPTGNRCTDNNLDHRWQKSFYSDRVYCTKCGDPHPENQP